MSLYKGGFKIGEMFGFPSASKDYNSGNSGNGKITKVPLTVIEDEPTVEPEVLKNTKSVEINEKKAEIIKNVFLKIFSTEENRGVEIFSQKKGYETPIGTYLRTAFYDKGALDRLMNMFKEQSKEDVDLNGGDINDRIKKFCLENLDSVNPTVDTKTAIEAVCNKMEPVDQIVEHLKKSSVSSIETVGPKKLSKREQDIREREALSLKAFDAIFDLEKLTSSEADDEKKKTAIVFGIAKKELEGMTREFTADRKIKKEMSLNEVEKEMREFFLEKSDELQISPNAKKLVNFACENVSSVDTSNADILSAGKREKSINQLKEQVLNVTDRTIKKIKVADVENLAPLSFFTASLQTIKRGTLSEKDSILFEESCAYGIREIEKVWLERKQENKKNVEIESAEARKILGNVIRDELKKKIEEKGFVNVQGGTVLNGKQFADASIYLMGSIVAKNFQENDEIIKKIIEAKWKGEKWKLNDAETESLSNILDATFSSGELTRAAYISYEYDTVGKELSNNQKNKDLIEKWRLSNGLPKEMQPAEKKALVDKLMLELTSSNEDSMKNFIDLRKKKSDAHLDGSSKKAILELIKNYLKKEFFVEDPLDIEKEETFEIAKEHWELFEYDLIRTIKAVREINGDDLDIDFIPAEKHFAGNIKEEMELLLNKGGAINEKSKGKEAQEYWKELERLDEFAKEIIALENTGMVCVVHDGNTFFIKNEKLNMRSKNINTNSANDDFVYAGVSEGFSKHDEEGKEEKNFAYGDENFGTIDPAELLKEEKIETPEILVSAEKIAEQKINEEEIELEKNRQEKERLTQERIEAEQELNLTRKQYFDAYNQKKKQYRDIYGGLFLSNRDKADKALSDALINDTELAQYKARYEQSLQKYKEAFMAGALFGLSGEKLEREKLANEKYLEIMERDAKFNAETQRRAELISPERSLERTESQRRAEANEAQRGWFAKGWENARESMRNNSRILRNTLVGGLVLGLGVFGASKLSDNEVPEEKVTPESTISHVEKKKSSDDRLKKDVQNLEQAQKEKEDFRKKSNENFKKEDVKVAPEALSKKDVEMKKLRDIFAQENEAYRIAIEEVDPSNPSSEQTDEIQRADNARKSAAREIERLADAKVLGMIDIADNIKKICSSTGYKWHEIKDLDYGNAFADDKLRLVIEKMSSEYKNEFKEDFYPEKTFGRWFYKIKKKTSDKRLGIEIK